MLRLPLDCDAVRTLLSRESVVSRSLSFLCVAVCLLFTRAGFAQQNPDGQLPIASFGNPLIMLLRDAEVLRDIKATAAQREELAALGMAIDRLVWPARNQSQAASQQAWQNATELAQTRAGSVLSSAQQQRIEQIIYWIQGTRALARPDVADRLQLREKQTAEIQEVIDATNEKVAALQKQAVAGEPVKPLEEQVRKLQREEQQQILKVLTSTQKSQWLKLAGPTVAVNRLGHVSFTAPELIASPETWLNPAHAEVRLADKVTAVHFFAFGCINCQRNYPHYLGWQKDLMPKGLQIVGIHTPETSAEQDVERLRQRMQEAGLEFPVLVDNAKQNWNAWGNSMWPSVYLVDRQGRIRYWWYGELSWQGADGEQRLRQRIEELLAERTASSAL